MVENRKNISRLIIIRHCEALGNTERVFQGHSDCDITENGACQLEKLAERMKDIKFDAIISSPLLRARKTAEAADTYMKLPIQIDERLIEINGGEWEMKKWASFPELYPENARAWNLFPHKFSPEGGEKMTEVYDRMSGAAVEIAKKHMGQTVCLVSHGCAIRNLMCWAKGWDIERLKDVDWCDNTGINVIDIDDELKPHVVVENDNSHLDSKLSTFAHQDWWKRENQENMKFS